MNKPTTTIYWQIVVQNPHSAKVKFWSTEKNAVFETMVKITDETLRATVEAITGRKNFILKEVRK